MCLWGTALGVAAGGGKEDATAALEKFAVPGTAAWPLQLPTHTSTWMGLTHLQQTSVCFGHSQPISEGGHPSLPVAQLTNPGGVWDALFFFNALFPVHQ